MTCSPNTTSPNATMEAALMLSSGLAFRGTCLEASPAVREPHGAGTPSDRSDDGSQRRCSFWSRC